MKNNVIQYSILISTPSDITDEVESIKRCIDKFNRGVGYHNNINLLTRYWEDDAYPEQGDAPQNIINKQLVEPSDAVIAILWTRFGTPTGSHGSGTEEEINKLKEKGRQIFLYFSEKATNPYDVDPAQFEKVKEFKKQMEKEGLYNSFKTLQEFENKLFKHLCDYFTYEKKLDNESALKHMSYLKIDLKNILSNKFLVATIQKTLDASYNEFRQSMTMVFSPKYDNERNIYSIEGAVPGAFKIYEGILEFDDGGNIYIAFINGKQIKYYTNDNKYVAEIPDNKAMQEWLHKRKFEDYIYFCSVPPEKLQAVNGKYLLQRAFGSKSTVEISVENQIVDFKCRANYGLNVAHVDGQIDLIDGYLATYEDDKGNKLKFTFFDDKIILKEQGQFGGNGVTLNGQYCKCI